MHAVKPQNTRSLLGLAVNHKIFGVNIADTSTPKHNFQPQSCNFNQQADFQSQKLVNEHIKALTHNTQNCKDFSEKVGEKIVAHIKKC